MQQPVRLVVNARQHEVLAPPHATLLDVLRDRLELTGAKRACDRGECGACTVLVEGPDGTPTPAYACLTLAVGCAGRAITTVEGLGGAGGLHPLQRAFIAHDAAQCGFCTPGQLVAAAALLATNAAPTRDEVRAWMSGNLCRCGTYPKIVAAVLDAAAEQRDARDHAGAADGR